MRFSQWAVRIGVYNDLPSPGEIYHLLASDDDLGVDVTTLCGESGHKSGHTSVSGLREWMAKKECSLCSDCLWRAIDILQDQPNAGS